MCTEAILKNILQLTGNKAQELFGDRLKKIVLYGSYARGDYDEESDIDVMLLVDMDDEETRKFNKQIARLMSDVVLEYGISLSPVIQDSRQFDKYKKVLPFFVNIEKEGVRIDA